MSLSRQETRELCYLSEEYGRNRRTPRVASTLVGRRGKHPFPFFL